MTIFDEVLSKIQQCSINVMVCPDVDELDAKICLELGASVLLGKHIIVFVPPGRTCPRLLEKVAFEVIHSESELPKSLERLAKHVTSNN